MSSDKVEYIYIEKIIMTHPATWFAVTMSHHLVLAEGRWIETQKESRWLLDCKSFFFVIKGQTWHRQKYVDPFFFIDDDLFFPK